MSPPDLRVPIRESFPELGYGVADAVRALREGLLASRADALASALDVPLSQLAGLLPGAVGAGVGGGPRGVH